WGCSRCPFSYDLVTEIYYKYSRLTEIVKPTLSKVSGEKEKSVVATDGTRDGVHFAQKAAYNLRKLFIWGKIDSFLPSGQSF
ncbi:MAG: hypothetical protein ACYSX1_02695, partial [Planctomycetota bacterium]